MNFTVLGLAFTYPYYILVGTGVFFFLNVLDILTTKAIVAHGGRERNPLMAKLMEVMGVSPALIVSKVLVTTLVVLLAGFLDAYYDSALIAVLIVFYFWAVRRNWKEWKEIQARQFKADYVGMPNSPL